MPSAAAGPLRTLETDARVALRASILSAMNLDKLLIILALACFVVAFICAAASEKILGLGTLGWIPAGLGIAVLAQLFGGVGLRRK